MVRDSRMQYYYLENKYIEWSLILGLFYFQFCPIPNITVRFILLFLLLISAFFNQSFYQVNNIRCFIFIFLLTIFLSLYHGLTEAKNFFIFCFGILSASFFSRKYSFSGTIIYKYFFYVIVPLSILNYLLYHNVYYLPFTTGYVNIFGKDITKHSTAIIGTLLFIGAVYNILKNFKRIQLVDIIFIILGFYFVAFSGARSCLLALIGTIILFIINMNKYKTNITIIYFIVMFVLVYFAEYVQNYVHLIDNEFILDLIGAKNFKTYGVTSGREWLWNYHWDAFVDSPYLLGRGKEVTDFTVNDYLPSLRRKAPAGSESPFTGMLACYGIIALFQFGILIFLSYKAIKKKNLLATCIIFIAIYNGLMGVYFIDVLQAYPILLYLLYFSSFYENKVAS